MISTGLIVGEVGFGGALSGLVGWFWLMLSLFPVLIISTETEVGVC